MKFKYFTFLLIHLFVMQNISAQGNGDIKDYLKLKFNNYVRVAPWEEIYIHTDRETYIAGEDMWFSVYLLDRNKMTASLSDKVVYFELLNRTNTPVAQSKIMILDSQGQGHIVIPDSLRSGAYTIRAYTNLMKNFLPDNCFIKQINIYNAFVPETFNEKILYQYGKAGETSKKFNIYGGVLSCKIENSQSDHVGLIIKSTVDYRKENNNNIVVFIQTHGEINYIREEQLISDSVAIVIPRDVLIPGINHITLFNNKGIPVYEKYIYTPRSVDAPLSISVTGDLSPRSIVDLKISLNDFSNKNEIWSKMSVSVIPGQLLDKGRDFDDYIVFGSEFGEGPWNVVGERKLEEISNDEMDSILAGMESKWIRWQDILSENTPGLKYLPELAYHYIPGKFVTRNTNTIGSGQVILISSPGKKALLQYAITGEDAGFSIRTPINDLYKDLVVQPADYENNSIKIESSFPERYLNAGIKDEVNLPSRIPAITKLSTNYQVQKIYETGFVYDLTDSVKQAKKIKQFYGKPDIELIMDDYIKLPVMEEVFFELLPGVFMKKKKAEYEITVANPIDNAIYEYPPGIFIDGVPMDDHNIIAAIDPVIVERIDVVKEMYYVGDLLFHGIINIITRAGDFNAVELPAYATRFRYKVTDPVSSFLSPDYSSESKKPDHVPDFRNTEYWDPLVQTGDDGKASLKYWSSDNTSDCIISIQGITNSGRIVSFRGSLNTEFKLPRH